MRLDINTDMAGQINLSLTLFFFLRQLAHALEFLVGRISMYTLGSSRMLRMASSLEGAKEELPDIGVMATG
jgi:hypothetical protein